MSNAEINRRISEARGEKPSMFNTFTDWTGSEDACAVLLEEMPKARVERFPEANLWGCIPDADRFDRDFRRGLKWCTTHPLMAADDEDRKTAVALAWLKWRESL